MLCEGVLSLCHKFRHIVTDDDTVAGRRKDRLQPFCSLDTEREPPVKRPDGCKPDTLLEDLPDAPGSREDERASFRKEPDTAQAPELVISYGLDSRERTVLRVFC